MLGKKIYHPLNPSPSSCYKRKPQLLTRLYADKISSTVWQPMLGIGSLRWRRDLPYPASISTVLWSIEQTKLYKKRRGVGRKARQTAGKRGDNYAGVVESGKLHDINLKRTMRRRCIESRKLCLNHSSWMKRNTICFLIGCQAIFLFSFLFLGGVTKNKDSSNGPRHRDLIYRNHVANGVERRKGRMRGRETCGVVHIMRRRTRKEGDNGGHRVSPS